MTLPRSQALAAVVASLIAIIAWLAVAIQIILTTKTAQANGFSAGYGVVKALSYFTILTNLLVAIVSTAVSRRGFGETFLTRPSMLSATAVYIAVVGAIYALLLKAMWEPTGLQLWVDVALHDAVPILYVVFWFVFVPKGALTWSTPFVWLGYPLAYVCWSLLRGAITTDYPYPFADPAALGYGKVALNTLAILAGFCALGFIVVALDRAIGGYRSRSR